MGLARRISCIRRASPSAADGRPAPGNSGTGGYTAADIRQISWSRSAGRGLDPAVDAAMLYVAGLRAGGIAVSDAV